MRSCFIHKSSGTIVGNVSKPLLLNRGSKQQYQCQRIRRYYPLHASSCKAIAVSNRIHGDPLPSHLLFYFSCCLFPAWSRNTTYTCTCTTSQTEKENVRDTHCEKDTVSAANYNLTCMHVSIPPPILLTLCLFMPSPYSACGIQTYSQGQ